MFFQVPDAQDIGHAVGIDDTVEVVVGGVSFLEHEVTFPLAPFVPFLHFPLRGDLPEKLRIDIVGGMPCFRQIVFLALVDLSIEPFLPVHGVDGNILQGADFHVFVNGLHLPGDGSRFAFDFPHSLQGDKEGIAAAEVVHLGGTVPAVDPGQADLICF